jgi:hypothetical protein
LDGLTDKYLKELTISIHFVKFNKGTDIFKYGDYGDEFFVIMKGNVGVHIPNPLIQGWKSNYNRMHQLEKWKEETFTFRLQRIIDRYIKKLEITQTK